MADPSSSSSSNDSSLSIETQLVGTFHRRELRPPSESLSSTRGRLLFALSLAEGTMEGYFPLAEQFVTQGHPSFCGIGSLTMTFNALMLDPGRVEVVR
jgi:glutathione gamma-glutamylcysteinyltransferase